MHHPEFMDTAAGPIGRVVASEDQPATAHEFYFWTAETEAARGLDIGHIVAAESEDATAVAVLDDPARYSDLASFLDDFYACDGDASLEALSERTEILVFRGRALASRHRQEHKKSRRPVKSGPVYFATSEAIEYALGSDEFSGEEIPMLLHENGNETDGAPQRTPLYADADYLLGPEAGHLNITGMSGLSTKTSHALFTISSIFQKAEDKSVAALMFNVKGADLLFLDKPLDPPRDDEELKRRYESAGQRGLTDEEREMYDALGLEAQPFENLRIFAPLRHNMAPTEKTVHLQDIGARRLNTLRTAYGENDVVHPIVWELGDVLPHAGRVFDPQDYDDKFRGLIEYMMRQRVDTMRDFFGLLDEAEDQMEERETSTWNGHHRATIAKARNRFNGLPSKCQGLLVDGRVQGEGYPNVEDSFTDREMRVVDIAGLTGVPQDLVVTRVVQSIWEKAERGDLGVDRLVIFIDELNKYAPAGSKTSSLKDTLIDISARGRHLSLTLFGAQQFRSKVDDEVIGNAATSLYGRIGEEELSGSSYRSFSKTTHEELLQLEKGRLLLRHAHYAVPVFGVFPRPAVLMGRQGTRIFGENSMDLTDSVHAAMGKIMKQPPRRPQIKADIEGAEEDRVYEALDAVQAVHRQGHGAKDPYQNFKQQLSGASSRSNGGSNVRDLRSIRSRLDGMPD